MPKLTGDLVHGLLERIPLAEVYRRADGVPLSEIDRLDIRVLIVGSASAADAHALMLSRPVLKVLVVSPGSGDGEMHEFVPNRRCVGQICEETLARALRDAAVSCPPAWESL